MTAPKIINWVAASLLITMSTAVSQAQIHHELPLEGPNPTPLLLDNPNHDLQFFAPVDFDFECRPIRQQCGYFFGYEKVFWAVTGQRITVGDPNLFVESELIYGDSPFSFGEVPQQYQINNSIQDAPPSAKFGSGTRYEFGYYQGQNGWSIGILDGPEINHYERYGFQELDIPNTLPIIPQVGNNLTDIFDPNFLNYGFDFVNFAPYFLGVPGTGSNDFATSRYGWGSVHVNFRTPQDFLKGFVDYNVNIPNDQPGSSQSENRFGPGRNVVVANIVISADGTPSIDLVVVDSGGDGQADDLNGNNVTFFVVSVLDEDGEEIIIGNGIDYDDLHTFNVSFERFEVRNFTESDGIELMKTVQLDNRHLPVSRQGEFVELSCGLRYFRLNDEFTFDGDGGILGRTYATTGAENQIVGPQVRGRWSKQRGRWNLGLDGRFMFGYNIQDQTQNGAIGEDLQPGAVNSPIFAQPHAVNYGRQQQNFSPMAEIRVDGSYQITKSIAAKLGYTGMFIDNITRASETVNWFIPDLGILRGGEQDVLINGVDFGFEAVF
ncbi:BBP7 family outer membrane beta-barrel protein [Bythopirellula polymerisocia]|uniref:Uncharacterized protein n=1 Tax=Bythopirellula polymerisocia TaxID=2528003 RepID=A0A5C6CJQ7_9BACT|nr:BBP7 family outer membrane beta-barrel protein [Bythopirellula polymerisocia]TWU23724.1 hypothetical protein Pla144_38990 [Bythopirellula polymerisocia]